MDREPTRRALLRAGLAAGTLAGLQGLHALAESPSAAAAPFLTEAGSVPAARRVLLGRSVQGRRLWAHHLGDPQAETTLLVVGGMHGTEPAGMSLARRLIATTAPVRGVRLIVVPTMNPDGDARRTRQNARGVDLNRNFPGGRHQQRRGGTYYSGPRDLSEVEARVMHDLISTEQPDGLLVYHQQLNLVDPCGGSLALARRYAADSGLRLRALPHYPGSMATWLGSARPGCTILTVELPARVTATMRERHLAALNRLQAGLRDTRR